MSEDLMGWCISLRWGWAGYVVAAGCALLLFALAGIGYEVGQMAKAIEALEACGVERGAFDPEFRPQPTPEPARGCDAREDENGSP